MVVCGGGVASASLWAAGPGWLGFGGGSFGSCTDCSKGRSVPSSPEQQTGQSKMEMQHRAFRVPGGSCLCLQPYHPEQTRCHLILEAKQGRAWLVLGCETAWEYRVLWSLCLPSPFVCRLQARLAPQNPSAPDFPISLPRK